MTSPLLVCWYVCTCISKKKESLFPRKNLTKKIAKKRDELSRLDDSVQTKLLQLVVMLMADFFGVNVSAAFCAKQQQQKLFSLVPLHTVLSDTKINGTKTHLHGLMSANLSICIFLYSPCWGRLKCDSTTLPVILSALWHQIHFQSRVVNDK